MWRPFISLSLIGATLTGAAHAETFEAPSLGTEFHTMTVFEGEASTFKSRVIFSGDDFAITVNADEQFGPTDYLIEFSGVHFATCDGAMPSPEERQSLQDFWTAEPGAVISIGGDIPTEYTLVRRVPRTVLGQDDEVLEVSTAYSSEGKDESEFLVISKRLGAVIELDWRSAGGRDVVYKVASSLKGFLEKPPSPEMLGNCFVLTQ